MKKVLVMTAVALACLGSTATALAASSALPTFKSDLIVPNRSLAGVSLFSTDTGARRAFRTGGSSCSVKRGCVYESRDGSSFSIGFAITKSRRTPFVGEITISAADGFHTPLASLKTADGIGLGSTAAAVKRAYPRVVGSADSDYTLVGRGAVRTVFGLAKGRVTTISLLGVHVG